MSLNSVEWIADILCLHTFAYKLSFIAGDTSKPELPWAALAEQVAYTLRLSRGMRDYNDVVCLPDPAGIKSVEFEKAPGKMKTSWEYLLLAGPYGKYLLEECFSPDVQQVVFEYLDLLGLMWEKSISAETLSHPEKRPPIVLTMMEDLLPSCELEHELAPDHPFGGHHPCQRPLLGLGHVSPDCLQSERKSVSKWRCLTCSAASCCSYIQHASTVSAYSCNAAHL